jgi:hypothetical protein
MLFDEVMECTDDLASAFADGLWGGLSRVDGQWQHCDLEDGPEVIIDALYERAELLRLNSQIAATRAARNGGAK